MKKLRPFHYVAFLFVITLTAFDLWTKNLALKHFSQGKSLRVIGDYLELTLVHNTGAAFGLGAGWSMAFFVVTTIVAIGVVIYLFTHLRSEERFSYWGLVLILSGAFGNLIDRINLGFVVDFVLVHLPKSQCPHWLHRILRDCRYPVFNAADAFIFIGVVLFLIDMIRKPGIPKKKAPADASETSESPPS